jgi:hypothetical protein
MNNAFTTVPGIFFGSLMQCSNESGPDMGAHGAGSRGIAARRTRC